MKKKARLVKKHISKRYRRVFSFFFSTFRVTIDTLDQLAESKISAGGWGEEIKRFFQTSLDSAGKKIGSKFEVVYDVEAAVERVAKGEFAFYENIYFLKHASVRRQILAFGKLTVIYFSLLHLNFFFSAL